MNQVKLCFNGLEMLRQLAHLAAKSDWVGLGSFGFDTSLACWNLLPADSQIVVGISRDSDRHQMLRHHLGAFKASKKNLHVGIRDDFHAKYGLFRLPRSRWVMLGSANCTPSPAKEVVIFTQSDELYYSVAKRHEYWWGNSEFVEPRTVVQLSAEQLRSLLSAPTETK